MRTAQKISNNLNNLINDHIQYNTIKYKKTNYIVSNI